MRVLVALGGNALLRRGEALTVKNQRRNVKIAARALAPIAHEHELVISHGNGPQVGLLALQAAAYAPGSHYPLDLLGAQTEGMIGYIIEQELGNLMPPEQPLATILSMVEVDPGDPAFSAPTKPIGPIYNKHEAEILARDKGWNMAMDGNHYRRVVASPRPRRIFETRPIRWLLEKGCIVICAGGGGIPTAFKAGRDLAGAECVVDKDRASALLANELGVDLFMMATDAKAIYLDWGSPKQRPIRAISARDLKKMSFPAGSMGPKAEAAVEFVQRSGRRAVIGALADLEGMLAGESGTQIRDDKAAMEVG